jgi:DNA repair protein RAD5
MVKRFLCKGTIEEKINLLHDKKRKMAHDVIILSEKERKQADIEQFRYLFEE